MPKLRPFLVACVLLVLAGTCPAVEPYEPVHPDPVLEPWRWQRFPELQGLGLQCMTQDTEGRMWFGTDAGVRCYDGIAWTAYTPAEGLPGAPVYRLCSARDGSVYAGTERGISRFSEGIWTRVFPPEGDLPWYISDLLEASDGSLWAATGWGAVHLSGGKATVYTTAEAGAALRRIVPGVEVAAVPAGAVPERSWPAGIGVEVFPGWYFTLPEHSPRTIWSVAPGGPAAADLAVGDRILSVDDQAGAALDPSDVSARVPVRLTVQRAGIPDPFEVKRTGRPVRGAFGDFRVYDVYEDRQNRMWFGISDGLSGGEIVCFDPARAGEAGAWRLYDGDDNLSVGSRPRLLQTRDGHLWAVSDNYFAGVNRFDGQRWTNFRLGDLRGSDNNPALVQTRDGTLWVGGHLGYLHAYRDGVWQVYRAPEVAVPGNRIVDLVEAADGALWIGGQGAEPIRLDCGTDRWTAYEGLHFQGRTADGALWFRSPSCRAVRFDGQRWESFGPEDGLMARALRLLVTRKGTLWAAGATVPDTAAAVARFDGRRWVMQKHPALSECVHPQAIHEAADGSLWFGAVLCTSEQAQHGVLRFDEGRGRHLNDSQDRSSPPHPGASSGGTWTHYTPPEAPVQAYGIGHTPDGRLWFGGRDVRSFDGRTWQILKTPERLARRHSDVVYTSPEGDLWIGHRSYGVFRYTQGKWTGYDVRDGLADNEVKAILQTRDGSVWVATAKGLSRFDGTSWVRHALSPELAAHIVKGGLFQDQDGALWLNLYAPEKTRSRYWTVRYVPDAHPPETTVTLAPGQVSQPGNTSLAWQGRDPWRRTPEEQLQYAWRLDGGPWSVFSRERSAAFEALPNGTHTFEVKARDRDFNEDPTPAQVRFSVVPPVWQQPWFVIMVMGFVGVTGIQASRIVVRDRKLKGANTALSSANRELFGVNRQLQTSNQALKEEMAERERLDAQLAHLRYLDRLRTALEPARSAEAVVRTAGETLLEVMNGATSAGVILEHDGRTWRFGEHNQNGRPAYERPLSWGGNRRGRLRLSCTIALTEAQERALLDESAAQVARVLEARELEMQLLQSARLVSLGQMAAGVAHELNQPLCAISMTAGDIYQSHLEGMRFTPDQINARMRDLLGVVERMEGTIDQLRVFSRDTSQEPGAPFFLNDAIVTAMKMIQAQLASHGIVLEVDLAGWLPLTVGHPHRIEQVFLNLLANARDALDEKEKATGAFEKSIRVRTSTLKDNPRWIVAEVEDNGAGMDEEVQQRVFEPFFTTKTSDRGTGLGLSISYAIVKDHGGQISCESRKGEGTAFRVLLPAREEG